MQNAESVKPAQKIDTSYELISQASFPKKKWKIASLKHIFEKENHHQQSKKQYRKE